MLNPSLQNIEIQFSSDFFPQELTQKYDDFLFQMNHPFKTLQSNFMESIQQVNIPGLNISPLIIQSMDNTGVDPRNPALNPIGFPHATQNRAYEGNEPWWNVLEGTIINVTLRNNILNYMYCYEMIYNRYRRQNRVNQFNTYLILKDSAEIPMMQFSAIDCFLVQVPTMEFSFMSSFGESKSFDIGIQFNKLDVDFNIPDFKQNKIKLEKT